MSYTPALGLNFVLFCFFKLYMWGEVGAVQGWCPQSSEALDPLGAGTVDGWEPPGVGAGTEGPLSHAPHLPGI